LSGRELSVSGVADTVSLHRLMSELSGDRYNELHHRYYPLMVAVSGGTFDMGDVLNGDKAHRVKLSSFRMSATEVTVFQYGLYCALNEGKNIRENIAWPNSGDHPVVNVSWYDAVSYSNWLSERMGLRRQYAIDRDKVDVNNQSVVDNLKWTVTPLPGSDGYRLPTESEWEYAARGGEKSKGYLYAGGDSLDLVGWYNENSGTRTHSVGGKLPNELGLYDMSGNVWEWCWDWYGDYDDRASTNPQGAGKGDSRVIGGGGWGNDPLNCRAAYRYFYWPTSRYGNLGFRLASPLQ
jgi:sulfatase modifying factor 1